MTEEARPVGEAEITKRCNICGQVKKLSEFNRNKKTRDGLAGRCKPCNNRASAEWRAKNPDRRRELEQRHVPKKLAYMKAKHARLKAQVLEHYGTRCACCGHTEDLTIDHLNGDGYEHRQELFGDGRSSSARLYRWLVDNEFPPGFQTLCRSCNSSKYRDGYCKLHNGDQPSHLTTRDIRARIAACVDAASRGKPTVITNQGRPKAVLISYDEWIALRSAAG